MSRPHVTRLGPVDGTSPRVHPVPGWYTGRTSGPEWYSTIFELCESYSRFDGGITLPVEVLLIRGKVNFYKSLPLCYTPSPLSYPKSESLGYQFRTGTTNNRHTGASSVNEKLGQRSRHFTHRLLGVSY